MMKIKVLGVMAILSVLATSNVMASDYKHNQHADNKRKNSHVATHTNARVVVVTKNNNSHNNRINERNNRINEQRNHRNNHINNRKNNHSHHNNRNNGVGILVSGVVLGSILSGR